MALTTLFLLVSQLWVSVTPKVIVSSALHDIHVSRTEVNYDTQTSSVQVTVHLFIDDLEKSLVRSGHKALKLGQNNEATQADDAIAHYLEQHCILIEGGKNLKPTFIGKELSEDQIAFYCYLEYPINGLAKELGIKNNILTELYSDQKNMVFITKNKKRVASFLFDSEQYSDKVRL